MFLRNVKKTCLLFKDMYIKYRAEILRNNKEDIGASQSDVKNTIYQHF